MTALPAEVCGVSHRDRILNCPTPPAHDINPEGIPQELICRDRWFCWNYEWNGNRQTKVPKHPRGGYKIDVNTPTNWFTFAESIEAANRNGWGIGFAFNGDGLIGLDIDDCRNPDTGELQDWAAKIVRDLGSYCEISPSGTGVKGFVIGDLPEQLTKKHKRPDGRGEVEFFTNVKYFTATGNRQPGAPSDVRSRPEALLAVFKTVSDWKQSKPATASSTFQHYTPPSDDVATALAALSVLDPSSDYQTWLSVLMACHAVDPSEAMLAHCVAWSRGSDKFVEGEAQKKWRSFTSGGGVGIGTLCKLADDTGRQWRPNSAQRNDKTIAKHSENEVSSLGDKTPREFYAWKPFPLSAIPTPICDYIDAKANAIDVDPSQIALPMLVALGAAIGNTRRLRVTTDWFVPPILWGAVVCESGSAKTPSQNAALKFTTDRQSKSWRSYQEEQKEWETLDAYYQKSLNTWKRKQNTSDDPPEKPEKPILQQYRVCDSTIEALVKSLEENPRGILLARDELNAWFQSHDRYASKGSADQAQYLEMYNAGTVQIDRKTSGRLFVTNAAVSVIGTIQPGILRRALGGEQRESGLQARFLFAYPERRIRQMTDTSTPQAIEDDVATVFDRLWDLEFTTDEDGNSKPIIVKLSPAAYEMFRENTHRYRIEAHTAVSDLHAALSKLEETVARIALIIHIVCTVSRGFNPLHDSGDVTESSMQAAIDIVDWFKHETKRVYSMLRPTEDVGQTVLQQSQQRLISWISGKPDSVTAREVHRGLKSIYPDCESAEKALNQLVKVGLGSWGEFQVSEVGGRPTRKFVMSDSQRVLSPSDNSQETPDI